MFRAPQGPAVASRSSMVAPEHILQQSSKTKRMIGAIFVAFIILWLPWNIYVMLVMLDLVSESHQILAFTYILGYATACINPVLYWVFNENFKREFMSICHALRSRLKPCAENSDDGKENGDDPNDVLLLRHNGNNLRNQT